VKRAGKSEHTIQNEIRNALAGEAFLFRANVGTGYQGSGKPVRTPYPITVNLNPGDVLLRAARPFDTGLPVGFHDVFGWSEVTITPDMVGQTVAMFVSFDTKSETGKGSPEQIAFANAVIRSGGRSGFARSVDQARDIVHGRGSHESSGVHAAPSARRNRVSR